MKVQFDSPFPISPAPWVGHTPRVILALTQRLREGRDLTGSEIIDAVAHLADEAALVEPKADFLTALAQKGESPEELAGFAQALRDRSISLPIDAETRSRGLLDVCGTGGDRLNTFNISTTVGLVCAASGATVAKHGNRAITSKSGSADVLAALGIPVEQSPESAAAALREHRFAFLFAQRYHPAFKAIGPARRLCADRNQRTIFNHLGPLLNPARPEYQLVGASRPELVEPMARTLRALGAVRAMVVNGSVPGHGTLDEFSTLGTNIVAEFHHGGALTCAECSLDGYPLQPAALSDLEGGDATMNAGIIERILDGQDRGPRRDAVLLNAGAALFCAGIARSITEGWDRAAASIDSGAVRRTLNGLRG